MALIIEPGITITGDVSVKPVIPTFIGQFVEGGYYAGQYSATANGVATDYIIVAPKSSGETFGTWAACNTFCDNLTAGGYSDWFMPNRYQLDICYFNLKPTTESNNIGMINLYAVPARGGYNTAGNPPQTTAVAFQSGGTESFAAEIYWSGTISFPNTDNAWGQRFNNGQVADFPRIFGFWARAIRLIPI